MKISAAIIGMGIGSKHLQAIEELKNCSVKIICEKNLKKINYLRKKFPTKLITNDENKIFDNKDINLVSIASYDNFHYSQIIKSIKSKKHIIIEKPMCLNYKQLKKIYELLKKNNGIKIYSNLVLRVNKLFNEFKKRILKKNIFYIEADYIWGRKFKLYGWRAKIRDYSIISGAAIHMIDLCNWILASKPKSIFALGNKKSTKNTKFKKESFVVLLIKYPNNVIVKITANASGIYDHFHELKIFSKDKTLVNSRLGAFEHNQKLFKKLNFSYPDKANRGKMIQNFIKSLKNKKIKPFLSKKYQFELMSICFAGQQSLKLSKEIKIKYLK